MNWRESNRLMFQKRPPKEPTYVYPPKFRFTPTIEPVYEILPKFQAGLSELGDPRSPRESRADDPQESSVSPPASIVSSGACETANLGGNLE